MNTANLCKGFLVQSWMLGELMEHQYALLPNGRKFSCLVMGSTQNFGMNRTGVPSKWREITAIPEAAEFIGNYEPPRLLLIAAK